MPVPGTSAGGALGATYVGRVTRPVLLTTAATGVVAGPTVGFAAAAGGLVGAAAGVAGFAHAASSWAPSAPPSVVPPRRVMNPRREIGEEAIALSLPFPKCELIEVTEALATEYKSKRHE